MSGKWEGIWGLEGGATGNPGPRGSGYSAAFLSILASKMSSVYIIGSHEKITLTQDTPSKAFNLAPKAASFRATQTSAKLLQEQGGVRWRRAMQEVIVANEFREAIRWNHRIKTCSRHGGDVYVEMQEIVL